MRTIRQSQSHASGAIDAARQMANDGSLPEYRVGRNYIRIGDTVHVKPSRPGRHDGFDSKVLRIRGNAVVGAVSVDVTDPHNGNVRTLPTERIERKAQTKGGESTVSLFAPAVKEQLKARFAVGRPVRRREDVTRCATPKDPARAASVAFTTPSVAPRTLYADESRSTPYDFKPPYRPVGCRDAIRDAEKAGYAVLIIDCSHTSGRARGVLVRERNKQGSVVGGLRHADASGKSSKTLSGPAVRVHGSKQEWARQDSEGQACKPIPGSVWLCSRRGDIGYEFTGWELDGCHAVVAN